MMVSARLVLPGMVMSMLLAGPALADHGRIEPSRQSTHAAPERGARSVGTRSRGALASATRTRVRAARHGVRVALAGLRGRGGEDTREDEVAAGLVRPASLWSGPYDAPATDAPATDGPATDGPATDAHARGHGGGSHLTGAQVGMASWYGGAQWHGRATSSGERFDQDALTAAHATLPLGSMVRVSTLDGTNSVLVRITDRPGTRRRIIDLSRGAASVLGILSRGVAMVSLQPQ